MNAVGQSDEPIVVEKRMNEGNQREQDQTRQKPEEFVERRGSAKGNTAQAPTTGTQSPGAVSRGLIGVREAARRDKALQFTALQRSWQNSSIAPDSDGFLADFLSCQAS